MHDGDTLPDMASKRQERREQIERQLLEATERLMAAGASFTELSVDRLATEAGISRASFYIYFEDKGHLLRNLAGQVFADLADAGRPLVECRAATRPRRRQGRHRRDRGRLSASSTAARRAERDGRLRPTGRRGLPGDSDGDLGSIAAVIEQGQADGSIRQGLSPATAAKALTWMTERTTQQLLPGSPISSDPEVTDTLVEIIWAALYLEAP